MHLVAVTPLPSESRSWTERLVIRVRKDIQQGRHETNLLMREEGHVLAFVSAFGFQRTQHFRDEWI